MQTEQRESNEQQLATAAETRASTEKMQADFAAQLGAKFVAASCSSGVKPGSVATLPQPLQCSANGASPIVEQYKRQLLSLEVSLLSQRPHLIDVRFPVQTHEMI